MTEKIKVQVPIVLVGEAPALRIKENFLAQELNSLTVECLPDRIPSRIDLDVSFLTDVDQAIHVKDIRLGDEITVLNNPEQLVAKISIRYIEKEVPVEKVEAEVEAEAPEGAEQPEEAPEEESSESQRTH
jgi:large subunit ribosomal protein L25